MCLSELADECEIPPAFLYKVLRSLAVSGLLVSHRGITGGYELTSLARDSSVLDVVEAVDGLPLLNTCVLSGECHRAPTCPAHPVWIQAQERLREVLADARLADLARLQPGAPRRAGRNARPGRACATMRERPRVDHGIRTPVPGGRRPGGTHPKRMGNR